MGMHRKSRLTIDTGDPLHNLIKQHTNLQRTIELYTTQYLGGGLQGWLQVGYQSFSKVGSLCSPTNFSIYLVRLLLKAITFSDVSSLSILLRIKSSHYNTFQNSIKHRKRLQTPEHTLKPVSHSNVSHILLMIKRIYRLWCDFGFHTKHTCHQQFPKIRYELIVIYYESDMVTLFVSQENE